MEFSLRFWAKVKRRIKALLSATPSFVNSTFTAASATGTADGSTTNTLTLTVYDTDNALMPSQAVTFTTELTAVSASQSTLVDDAAEIETTTGTLNLILVCKDANGVALPNIQSARIVFASTGTGNTFGTPSVTDRNGQSLCTFSSTVAEAKTISVTVDGVAVTQTAAVTVTGAPAAPTLDFYSSWLAATGTGTTARGDGGKWGTLGGTGLEVIASTGLDFPTTNVLRVTATESTGGYAFARKTGLAVLAVGETRYYRGYIRVPSDTDVAVSDTGTHPHQDGNASSQSNWMLDVWHNTGGAGKWTPHMRMGGANSYPHDLWRAGTALDKDATYRWEKSLTRTATGTYRMEVRWYNSSNVLVLNSANYETLDGTSETLADYMTGDHFAFEGTEYNNLDGLNAGLNGLGGSDWFPSVIYAYQSGMATGVDCGWIGAYNAGNEP